MVELNFICIFSLLVLLVVSNAFLLKSRVSTVRESSASIQRIDNQNDMSLQSERPGTFGSKLLPPYTNEELDELYRELNVTRFDFANDPELLKWSPSKEFFEKFGFQNNTEKYKRKVADVKADFYAAYSKPILPQYKTFIADLIAVTFIQISDSRYKYDPLHAFGVCTQYYTVMKGYAFQDEVTLIITFYFPRI